MFQVNQNDINHVVLVFLILTLNLFHFFPSVSTVEFEQIHVSWGELKKLYFKSAAISCL